MTENVPLIANSDSRKKARGIGQQIGRNSRAQNVLMAGRRDHPAQPGPVDRASAHDAGLTRGDQRVARPARRSQAGRFQPGLRLPDRQDFRVGGGIQSPAHVVVRD